LSENHSNTTLLEHADDLSRSLEDNEICEWETCGAPAEYWLICPKCGAREFQCTEHSLMIRLAPPSATVIFDRACRHHVKQCECLTEKINRT